MDPVVHFEMPYQDRNRMAGFYTKDGYYKYFIVRVGNHRCWARKWASTWS